MFISYIGISGLDSIQKELKNEKRKADYRMPRVLEGIGSEMKLKLGEHIRDDWYDAYAPLHYKRRTDAGNPEALGAESSFGIAVDGKSLTFDYKPISNQWVPPDIDVSGDHLINIIQTGLGGKWNGVVPKRPYWNNFVREQEGILADEFISAVSPWYEAVKDENDVFDLSDFLLDE